MTRPARRHSPAVYRRRRLAVLLVLLLIVGGVVALVMWQPWRAIGGAGPTPPASVSSPAPTPAATETPDAATETPDAATESPATPDAGSASPSPSGTTIAVCSSGEVTVTAVTDQDSYGSDEKPQLSITLVNEGDEPCLINVGTSTQAFTIESGTDTWWRSTDCQTEPTDQVVQLEPGQSVSSVTPLTWDRTRSSVDTCDRDRAHARPGYYNVTVAIGGIDSDPRQFRLR